MNPARRLPADHHTTESFRPSPPRDAAGAAHSVAGGAHRCPLRGCIDGLFYGDICPTCGGRGFLNIPEAAA